MASKEQIKKALSHAILFEDIELARSFADRSADTFGYGKYSVVLGAYDVALVVTNREASMLERAGYELA